MKLALYILVAAETANNGMISLIEFNHVLGFVDFGPI